jgi:hypothetical protein
VTQVLSSKILRDLSKIYMDVAETSVSYIVFTDGSRYYAKNGSTGMIEFSGSDAGAVITSAINAMPRGGQDIHQVWDVLPINTDCYQ